MNHHIRVVRHIPTDPAVRSSESLFLTESAGQGDATRQLLGVEVVEEDGQRLIVRRRLMFVNGVPVRISNSYFPADAAEAAELMKNDFLPGGLQQLFERSGRCFGRAEESFTARRATFRETQLLELPSGDPVVHIVRTSFDTERRMVHRLESICAASRHTFVVTQLPGDNVF